VECALQKQISGIVGQPRHGRYFARNRLNILINSESHTYLQEGIPPPGSLTVLTPRKPTRRALPDRS